SCGVTSPYRFPIMIYPSPVVEPRKYRNIIILMANRHWLGRRPLEGRRFYPSPGKLPRVALRSILSLLRRVLAPGEDLSERAVTSGVWVALTNIVDRLLQLVIVLFVAR